MIGYVKFAFLKVQSGQSIMEYAFVLALVSLIVVGVLLGVGRNTRSGFSLANQALEESGVASRTGGPVAATGAGKAVGHSRP
jgi:Flp pilus assembly pilin Flp